MKTIRALLLPLIALAMHQGTIQEASAQVQHQIKSAKISYEMQQSPRYAAAGPKDKNWNPLDWLEIEIELDAETVNPSGYIDQLDVEYFVAVTDGQINRTVLLTDRISYLEVRASDRRAFLSAYVSPASLSKVTGKPKPGKSDISSVAAVITGPGLRTPVEASSGGPKEWWKNPNLQRRDGLVLAKSKTPFAFLWTDRYPRDATENR